jgi:hypothetical protein
MERSLYCDGRAVRAQDLEKVGLETGTVQGTLMDKEVRPSSHIELSHVL